MDRSLVVLVHGFGSSPATWDELVELFRKDPALSEFDFDNTFAYPAPWFNYNPFARIPELSELGNALAAHLGLSRFQPYRKIALIGHSQGGLVIHSYLASKLIAQHLHSHDPGKCGEVCKQRVRKNAIMSQHTGTPGIYSWEFENLSDGVIDVVWDVGLAAPKADAAGQGS
jgi:pimeloyl-ACP methyl ester carboxylesterase